MSSPSAIIGIVVRGLLGTARRTLERSPVRYLVVGGGCAALNWALMLLIDRDRYLASSLVLFVPIATLSFVLHATWTFRKRVSLRSWIAYVAGMLPGTAVSLAILAMLRDLAGLPLPLALPATVVAMTLFNYLVSWSAIAALADGRPLAPRISASPFRSPTTCRKPRPRPLCSPSSAVSSTPTWPARCGIVDRSLFKRRETIATASSEHDAHRLVATRSRRLLRFH